MLLLAFWLSLFLAFYTYAGYPILLRVLCRLKPQDLRRGPARQPTVSIVLALHNEASRVKARIENLLAQDYEGKVEIIVVSDGSTDATCEVAGSFRSRGVRVVPLPVRSGKALAVNEGVALAKGEIVVFADARQSFAADTVSRLVANFGDPSVGCVSGELIFLKDDASRIQEEMGAYWNYEKAVRKMESRSGSVVGATGAIYAIRRDLYRPLPAQAILDDVLTPLNVIGQGYRCLFDGSAVAYDVVSKDAAAEWKRKVRTLAGNWQMLSLRPTLLLPWRNPCWWRLISHKVLRLLVPLMLLVLLVSGALIPGLLYRAATVLQLLGYATALAGFAPRARRFRLVKLGYFFLVMNTATAAAFWRWISGGCATVWQASQANEGPALELADAEGN